MPYKDQADRSRWKNGKAVQRKQWLKEYLGGKCARCDGVEPDVKLEFDHIDPDTKEFLICRNITMTWKKLKVELDKCQLLCNPCHKEKTRLGG